MKSDYGYFATDDPNPFLEDEPPPAPHNRFQSTFNPTSPPHHPTPPHTSASITPAPGHVEPAEHMA